MATPAILTPATQLKLKNVLFATDFSEGSQHALRYVQGIAKAFGSTVHVCHIAPDVPLAKGVAAPQVYEATGKAAAEHLTALLNAPELKSVKVKLALGSGTIESELLRIIRDKNVDLVVAGTHGRTGLRHMLLGSVVEEICRVATCPVLTVGPCTPSGTEAPFRKILFPDNLSDVSGKILPYVILLAREFRAQVTVLHVLLQDKASAKDRALSQSMYKAMAQSLHPDLAFFQPDYVLENGDPAEVILRVARERQAGLIAMGVNRTLLSGLRLHSSTAYHVMAGAACPVLTQR